MWNVAVAPKPTTPPAAAATARCSLGTRALGQALKSGIHAAGSHSHVRTLPADDVAAVLHRRLHLGLGLLKRLGGRSSDAPSHLASAAEVTCPHCVTANGHRLAHSSTQYHSSHAGRLVHADIAGPFKRSWLGGFQYALVLTDDHTRFKFIYFLQAKSDAPDRVRRFIASFNALANLALGRRGARGVHHPHRQRRRVPFPAVPGAPGRVARVADDVPTTRAPAERRGRALHPRRVLAGAILLRG